MYRRIVMAAVSALVVLIPACSSQQGSAGSGELVVENVTAILSLPSSTGAVYMQVINGTDQDEALLGAEIDGCGTIELHEMFMDNDVMMMRAVEDGRLEIPAGETLILEPGGLHVMCLNKSGEFTVGDTIPISLLFENAGTIEVSAEVVAPGGMGMDENYADHEHVEEGEAEHEETEAAE